DSDQSAQRSTCQSPQGNPCRTSGFRVGIHCPSPGGTGKARIPQGAASRFNQTIWRAGRRGHSMGKAGAHQAKAGVTLDPGAVIALDRGDKRMIALPGQALAQGYAFRVPAGVVGQAWRDGRVQVTLTRFLRSREVEIIPLDEQLARACGELCGATDTSDMI